MRETNTAAVTGESQRVRVAGDGTDWHTGDAYTSKQAVLGVFVGAEVVRHCSGTQHRRLPVRRVAGYWSDAVVADRTDEHVHLDICHIDYYILNQTVHIV